MSTNSASIISTPDAWYCVSDRTPDLYPMHCMVTYHDVLFGLAKLWLWTPQSSPRCWLCQLRVHTSSQAQAASALLCIFETIHLPNCPCNSSCNSFDAISNYRGERARLLQHLQPLLANSYVYTWRSCPAHHQSPNHRLRFSRNRVSHLELVIALHRFLFHKRIDDGKNKKRVATIIHYGNGVSRHLRFAIRSVGYTWSLAKSHAARLVILFGKLRAISLIVFVPSFPFLFFFHLAFYFFWICVEGSGQGCGGTKKKSKKNWEKRAFGNRFLITFLEVVLFSSLLLVWYRYFIYGEL